MRDAALIAGTPFFKRPASGRHTLAAIMRGLCRGSLKLSLVNVKKKLKKDGYLGLHAFDLFKFLVCFSAFAAKGKGSFPKT